MSISSDTPNNPVRLRIVAIISGLLLVAALIVAAYVLTAPRPMPSNPAVIDTAGIHVFGDTTADIPGASSILARTAGGVTVSLDTVALTPNDAYSIWWVIFNNPAACATSPCKGSDLSNPATEGMVAYATGGVADGDGAAQFEASLIVGDRSNALDNDSGFPVELVEPAPGLTNAMSAEVHAVIRSHGAALPDPTLQITTFGGDCNPECKNAQAALHLPQMFATRQ